jgi:serine protease Do
LAEEQAFRQAVRAVAPSVVRIQTVGGLDRVGGRLVGSAATTGVVMSDDGYIVSSAFNFIAKPTSILVQIADGRHYAAKLIATDRLRMLTLLKVDAGELVPMPRRSESAIRVGQWAIAVGRTYESPEPSVSIGIVSAVNRVWGKAIQTDAKLSPVNYGGPLIDVRGQPLGIIVPLSPQGKEEVSGVEWYDSGIGFAIPFEDVLKSIERLKHGKDLRPGLLGITVKEGAGDEHPVIDIIRYDSPAERAGLKTGDQILDVDGRPVRRQDEVKLALGRKYAGDKVVVRYQRGKSPAQTEAQLVDALLPHEAGFLGILPARSPSAHKKGTIVRFVFAGSPAAKAGISRGDRINKWNATDIANADQLSELVRRVRPGHAASLSIQHGGVQKTVNVKLSAISEEVPETLPPAHSISDAASSVNAPANPRENKVKTGHFRDSLPGETAVNFWGYVPDSYTASEAWGLVVWIPPSVQTLEATILERWKTACQERQLLLVSPIPSEASGYNPNDLVGARQLLEHMLKTYRIDPNRVVVHGMSAGGEFASTFAFDNHEQIRGLALVASPILATPPEGSPAFPFKFYFSIREGDRVNERIQRVAEILRRMKFAVTLRTRPGLDQGYLSSSDASDLARWIDSLDRI